MHYDITPFFEEYEQLCIRVNKIFESMQQQYPDEVRCRVGCTQCCYALFDLSLIEAMYINHSFHQLLSPEDRAAVLERADQADRKNIKIKYRAHKAYRQGVETESILRDVGQQRIRCPLLSDRDTCLLYDQRPITCRLYGLPLSIGGQVHTCEHTGFETGEKYPTVYVDTLQDYLFDITKRFVQSVPTTYSKLAEVFVPLSMALLNEYTPDYLGIPQNERTVNSAGSATEWVLGNTQGE
jgi:Fe-S-cluster containining protein